MDKSVAYDCAMPIRNAFAYQFSCWLQMIQRVAEVNTLFWGDNNCRSLHQVRNSLNSSYSLRRIVHENIFCLKYKVFKPILDYHSIHIQVSQTGLPSKYKSSKIVECISHLTCVLNAWHKLHVKFPRSIVVFINRHPLPFCVIHRDWFLTEASSAYQHCHNQSYATAHQSNMQSLKIRIIK